MRGLGEQQGVGQNDTRRSPRFPGMLLIIRSPSTLELCSNNLITLEV